VTEKMGLANEPPEGLIFHSAGELEGRFQVFTSGRHPSTSSGSRASAYGRDIEIAIHNYLIP